MRVLLINPPWVKRAGNVWQNISSIMPPLGMAWMAAVLEREGHAVQILDAHAEQVDLNHLSGRLRELGPADLVGITATTPLISNALAISRIIKADMPRAMVVLGGVHPTVLPGECLAEESVDVVVRGEGEETIKELAGEKVRESIRGISFRAEEGVRHNPERELIRDLDTLPMPAYHLLPMSRYYPAVGAFKRLPASSMLATRGCPGRCTFCYRIFGDRLRVRSGRRIAEEAKYLQDRFGIREICFYDDTFTAIKRVVREFCEGLRDLKVDLTWSCFSRVDTINEDGLWIMKETGCHQIMFGIEAASPVILKNIGKRTDSAKAEEAVQLAKKVGMDVRAAFMIGNPGETEETLEGTMAFAMRLNPELAIFNITTPFPGTEMFAWADKQGYLRTKDWADYDLSNPVMELPTISAMKVQEFYRKAYRRFFLRGRYIAMRLRKIRTLKDLASALQGVRAVMKV